jgi:hypothetical protein
MENNINSKYLIFVRKLKESFLLFNDNLLEVFPTNKNLFIQRVISYQLPDIVLYKLLKNNINFDFIENKDEYYLNYELCFLKNYENYMSCGYKNNNLLTYKLFTFKELYNNDNTTYFENIDIIWNWLYVFNVIIKNIDKIQA